MKFNWINKGMNKVLNKESAPAYRLTPEWELYTLSLIHIFEPTRRS